MNILLIDAYDSFVHIIYQYLLSLDLEVEVIRNDQLNLDLIEKKHYHAIVLGPGPGHPHDAHYLPLIDRFKEKVPLLGVCLGLQAITLAFGGRVVKANHLMHGKTSLISHTNVGCFRGLSNPLTATRYHSLIAEEASFPHDELDITATSCDDHYIMGLKHKHFNIEGVQFHPESICTEQGLNLFKNFFDSLHKPHKYTNNDQ